MIPASLNEVKSGGPKHCCAARTLLGLYGGLLVRLVGDRKQLALTYGFSWSEWIIGKRPPPSGIFVLRTGTPCVLRLASCVLCLVSYVALLAATAPGRHILLYVTWLAITTNHVPAQKEQHANCLMLHLRESAAAGT